MSAVRRRLHRGTVLAALIAVACAGGPAPRRQPAPTVLVEQSFADPAALAAVEFSDPAAWRHRMEGETGCLELFAASDYAPPVRSPLNIALVRDRSFGSFTLDVELRQTGREYGHRDLCLFFGFQSPQRFYYVHLASQADANAHNVFRVQDAPRASFARQTTAGIEWGEVWHAVRLVRDLEAGTIRVFFDDMQTPIMEAEDRSFGWGRVGFGSFDDVGCFRNLRITGEACRLEDPADGMFSRDG